MRKKEENLNTASGLRIAMILLGIAVTPVLLSSSSLGNQLSSSSLISVVLLGGVILTLLSAIAINILMAISLFGWIAVTANMFGHSVHDLLAQHGLEVPLALLVAAGCVIFVASTAFGFTVLGKIAQVAVPVIALVLCYILYVATHTEVAVPAAIVEMNTGVAVSTVVGTIIVLVATLPDFGSFVHNRKHALIAAGVTFLVAYPLLYWAGATPSAISGQGSLLGAMAVFGAVLPAALLLIFACVTGNAGNMFQGTLVVSTLLTRFPKWQITVALGILSAIVGSMDIMAWFIPFLLFLGIATPPVAGIYIADFFLYRRNGYQESVLAQESQIKVLTFAAWIIGAAVGFMTVKGLFTLTTIPSVDSILVACIAYAILSRASQHR
ncbi:TPA: cytosine permease [Escherichia coli]|nr:cytosine permease [Escherichia coli]